MLEYMYVLLGSSHDGFIHCRVGARGLEMSGRIDRYRDIDKVGRATQ